VKRKGGGLEAKQIEAISPQFFDPFDGIRIDDTNPACHQKTSESQDQKPENGNNRAREDIFP
jgi:hypothetical protein